MIALQEEIKCPVSAFKERSVIAAKCKRLGNYVINVLDSDADMLFVRPGEKWASVWKPEVGVRVRQGDKLCSLAQERLNVTSFPSQQFPRGIMVSKYTVAVSSSLQLNRSTVLLTAPVV